MGQCERCGKMAELIYCDATEQDVCPECFADIEDNLYEAMEDNDYQYHEE